MKKMMGLILLLVLAFSSIVGCSSDNKNAETSKPASSESVDSKSPVSTEGTGSDNSTGGLALPIVDDGSVTLTVAINDNWYSQKSYKDNLPVMQQLEKRTGVKINWEVTPGEQFKDVMRLRVAAAKSKALPDIIRVPDSAVKLGAEGLIIPLNDLIDKYAPNIKKFYEEHPEIYKSRLDVDGNLYALDDITGANTNPYGFLIRKDWLDKLNLQAPTNLDEWYTVLKAFRDHFDGVIPFMPFEGKEGLMMFGNALGLQLTYFNSGYTLDANGKLVHGLTQPEGKQLYEFLHKLYSEKLIPADYENVSEDQQLALIAQGKVGAINQFLMATPRYNNADPKGEADWILIDPPANAGYEPFYNAEPIFQAAYGISKDSKNPEVAIKWLDYFYASEEGIRLRGLGVEGLSYNMVNGKPEFTDLIKNNPDKLDPGTALMSIGALTTLPSIQLGEGIYAEGPQALLGLNPKLAETSNRVKPYLVDVYPFALATPEEEAEVRDLNQDIKTYSLEMSAKFISGQESLDNWDKYIDTLKKLKLDRVTEIFQQRLDRVK